MNLCPSVFDRIITKEGEKEREKTSGYLNHQWRQPLDHLKDRHFNFVLLTFDDYQITTSFED